MSRQVVRNECKHKAAFKQYYCCYYYIFFFPGIFIKIRLELLQFDLYMNSHEQ